MIEKETGTDVTKVIVRFVHSGLNRNVQIPSRNVCQYRLSFVISCYRSFVRSFFCSWVRSSTKFWLAVLLVGWSLSFFFKKKNICHLMLRPLSVNFWYCLTAIKTRFFCLNFRSFGSCKLASSIAHRVFQITKLLITVNRTYTTACQCQQKKTNSARDCNKNNGPS